MRVGCVCHMLVLSTELSSALTLGLATQALRCSPPRQGPRFCPLPHSKPDPWLKPRRHRLLGINKDPIGIC